MTLNEITEEVRGLLKEGPLDYAQIVDVYLDDEVRHYSDLYHEITVDDGSGDGPIVYEPVGSRIVPPVETRQNQSLDEETISIEFDSSRAADDMDFVGSLIDANLIQRRVRIRKVLFRPGTGRTVPIWLFDYQDGIADMLDDQKAIGDLSKLTLRISSGTFSYLERRNVTLTPSVQRSLHPNDTSLNHIARLVGVELPWGQ